MTLSGSLWLKIGLFSVGLGQSFVFVIVPPLARDLGLSEFQTSLIFAISALAWALTSASWGRLSDKYGRRNIAMLGLIGYALSLITMITPLFLVERNILDVIFLFPLLIFGRLLNGLLGSATRPASFAYIADITTSSNRTVKFARLESSFLLGTVMGPLIGGFLILITKETPFYVFSFLAIIATCGIYSSVDNSSKEKSNSSKTSKISWLSNTVWPFLLVASIGSLCQASLLQSIGFYVYDIFSYLDRLPVIVSMTFALLAISTIVSQYIFTDFYPLNTTKLLLCGVFLIILSSMSALGSCIIGGPIANVLIVFELTSNYQAALSAGVCIVVATIVSSQLIGQSTFDQLLNNRKIDITVGRDILFLQRKKIKEIVDKNFLKLDGEIKVRQAIEEFKKMKCSEGYYIAKDNKLLGKISLPILLSYKMEEKIKDIKKSKFLKVYEEEDLSKVIEKCKDFVGESIPVIDKKGKIIGIFSENDLFISYLEAEEFRADIETKS